MGVARGLGVPTGTLGIVGMPSEGCQDRQALAAMSVRRDVPRPRGHRHSGFNLRFGAQLPSHRPLAALVAAQEDGARFASHLVVVTA